MTTAYFHARQGLSVLLVALFTSAIVADTPTVSYIFPAGGQRGTTVTFNVGGHYLHDQCSFQMIGPGVQARLTIKRADHTTW